MTNSDKGSEPKIAPVELSAAAATADHADYTPMPPAAAKKAGLLRRLYDWVLAHAETPAAPWTLAAVSFAESSFFPIPPDALLVPMGLARPSRAWHYAAIASAASVVGGLFGYAIGALLYDTLGQWIITAYGYAHEATAFREAYAKYGHWIILLKGFTPIPYKLVTITAGLASYNLLWFVLLSILTRGARFFVVAGILYWMGERAREFIEKRLGLVTAVGAAVVIAGFIIAVVLA